jgi:hypothetical protein
MASPTDPNAVTPTGTVFDQIHAQSGGTTGTVFDQIHQQAVGSEQQQPAAQGTPTAAQQQPERTLGGFISNIPGSAARFAGSLWDAGKLAVGGQERAMDAMTLGAAPAIRRMARIPNSDEEQEFDQVAHHVWTRPVETAKGVGDYVVQRYGSVDKAKQTAYEDPVGFASDLSTVLGGGASALKISTRVANVAKLARTADVLSDVGDVASKASEFTNPLTAPGKVVTSVAGGAMTKAAKSLYQGALKPSVTNGAAENAAITETGLKAGIPLNSDAAQRGRGLAAGRQEVTSQAIGSSNAQIDPQNVAAIATSKFKPGLTNAANPGNAPKIFDANIQDYLKKHTPEATPVQTQIPFKPVGVTTGKEMPESAGGGVGPGFTIYEVPTDKLRSNEDISGMPDKLNDARRYGELMRGGSQPPPLFGHFQADTGGVNLTSGSRRLMGAQMANQKTLPVVIPTPTPGASGPPQSYPIQEAQAEKIATYDKAANSYGKDAGVSPEQTATKALAYGLKTAMEQFLPELKGLNQNEAVAMGLRDALERFVAREGNGGRLLRFLKPDMASGILAGGAGVATHNVPVMIGAHLLTKALEDPGVQSRIAIGLYKSANNPGTPYIRRVMTPASRIAEVKDHIQGAMSQQQQAPQPAPQSPAPAAPQPTAWPTMTIGGVPRPEDAVNDAHSRAQQLVDAIEAHGHRIQGTQPPLQ